MPWIPSIHENDTYVVSYTNIRPCVLSCILIKVDRNDAQKDRMNLFESMQKVDNASTSIQRDGMHRVTTSAVRSIESSMSCNVTTVNPCGCPDFRIMSLTKMLRHRTKYPSVNHPRGHYRHMIEVSTYRTIMRYHMNHNG